MTELLKQALPLALSALAGCVIGALFFGGLWWTIRKSLVSSLPGVWIFLSFLLRMGIALAGFYWVAGSQWQQWLAGLLGFFMVRVIMARMTRCCDIKPGKLVGGPFDAPESR